jgi:predicted ribosomally synthesized peptide with SipW-like signal peptide
MANKNLNKRALIVSVMVMLVCFTMLIGTTFAWFTDSVESGSNVITAGNLDLKVEYTLDGENWEDLDGAEDLFQNDLWEPGHTEVVALKVTNAGSLALKYSVNMNILNETFGKNAAGEDIVLSEILTVGTLVQEANQIGEISVQLAFQNENMFKGTTPFNANNVISSNVQLLPGSAHYVIIKVDMAETVGNEANAKDKDSVPSIDFGIEVLAAQFAYEEDFWKRL